MDNKTHYEKYWKAKDKNETFFNYERNWVLPRLFKRGDYLLDLGCGDGAVAEYLQKMGVKVVAADISQNALKVAKSRGLETILLNVEDKLPFKSGQFDKVFWGDNIEHLFSPEETLKEIRRVLKPQGRLIISCPNMGYWIYRLYYLLKGRLADSEWTGNPPWAWSHIRFFNLKIIRNFLNQENFRIVKAIGVNRRFPDRYLAKLYPDIFAMILVIESIKA